MGNVGTELPLPRQNVRKPREEPPEGFGKPRQFRGHRLILPSALHFFRGHPVHALPEFPHGRQPPPYRPPYGSEYRRHQNEQCRRQLHPHRFVKRQVRVHRNETIQNGAVRFRRFHDAPMMERVPYDGEFVRRGYRRQKTHGRRRALCHHLTVSYQHHCPRRMLPRHMEKPRLGRSRFVRKRRPNFV